MISSHFLTDSEDKLDISNTALNQIFEQIHKLLVVFWLSSILFTINIENDKQKGDTSILLHDPETIEQTCLIS